MALRRNPETAAAWEERTREKRRAKTRTTRSRALPAVNPERRARRFVRNYHSAAYVAWIRAQPCAVSGQSGGAGDPIVAAHVRSRGAGGDWTSVIPLRQSLHDESHRIGVRSFEARHGVRLDALAAGIQARWIEHAGPDRDEEDEG